MPGPGAGPGEPGHRPPAGAAGLQAERTALAWQRTGVSAAALSGIAVLAAAHDGSHRLVAGVSVLAAGCAACGALTARRPRVVPGGLPASPFVRLVAATAASVLLCVAGVVLVVAALSG